MLLTIDSLSQMLQVPEDTVCRWVRERGLPAVPVNGKLRANPMQVLEWATELRIPVRTESLLTPPDGAIAVPRTAAGLAAEPCPGQALRRGGVLYGVPGRTRSAVLRAIAAKLPATVRIDRDELVQLLEEREVQANTYLADGVALPHPRFPVIDPSQPPTLVLAVPAEAPAWGPHGEPAEVVCLLLSPNVRTHLLLVSRIAAAQADLRELLRKHAPLEKLCRALTVAPASTAPLSAAAR